ncbi:type II secretion system F family protein [Candidatus Pacearchaeota archaeon]|nr:type II secretion system F family protein [Candidatus Pacearchaeota archaeon]
MNTLKFYPKTLRDDYEKNIINSGIKTSPEKYHNSVFYFSLVISLISLILFFIISVNLIFSLFIFLFFNILFYFRINLKASTRIKKMEDVFPDVISLMASNLRSGITIDRAFLMAARPEFDPLDQEILKTGKEISTGQDIIISLKKMSERISSEKISKVINLIISGLKAGGNISELLDETSRNMKEKEIIEKKTRSTILMYVIFIFFAVGVGAPVLFGLSTVLVQIVLNITSKLPDLSASQSSLPFSFSKLGLSVNFVVYFSIIFIAITDLVSCLVIGLVNKGEGKAGLKFYLPLLFMSLSLFFIIRTVLTGLLKNAVSFI